MDSVKAESVPTSIYCKKSYVVLYAPMCTLIFYSMDYARKLQDLYERLDDDMFYEVAVRLEDVHSLPKAVLCELVCRIVREQICKRNDELAKELMYNNELLASL